jgi:hypothetical protein
VKRLGHARRVYEAGLRSGWDSYHTVRADISGPSRQVTTVEGGAIAAARTGNVGRLVDCLRARKPMTDDDRDRLAAYLATKLRRRRWPPELVRALSRSPTEDDYDLLADCVEATGRQRGRVLDEPAHRAARLAEVLMSLVRGHIRGRDKVRDAMIERACEIEGDESGVAIDHDRVRNLLLHPKARGHKR